VGPSAIPEEYHSKCWYYYIVERERGREGKGERKEGGLASWL